MPKGEIIKTLFGEMVVTRTSALGGYIGLFAGRLSKLVLYDVMFHSCLALIRLGVFCFEYEHKSATGPSVSSHLQKNH